MKHGVRADGDMNLSQTYQKQSTRNGPGWTPGHFVLTRLQRSECSIACEFGLSNLLRKRFQRTSDRA
jgi:hypothetical protein